MATSRLLDLPPEIFEIIVVYHLSDKDLLQLMQTSKAVHKRLSDDKILDWRYRAIRDERIPVEVRSYWTSLRTEWSHYEKLKLSDFYKLSQKFVLLYTPPYASPSQKAIKDDFKSLGTLLNKICPAILKNPWTEELRIFRIHCCMVFITIRLLDESVCAHQTAKGIVKASLNHKALLYLIKNSNIVFECDEPKLPFLTPPTKIFLQMVLAPWFLHLRGNFHHQYPSFHKCRAWAYMNYDLAVGHAFNEDSSYGMPHSVPQCATPILAAKYLIRLIIYWHGQCSGAGNSLFSTKFSALPGPDLSRYIDTGPRPHQTDFRPRAFRVSGSWNYFTTTIHDKQTWKNLASFVRSRNLVNSPKIEENNWNDDKIVFEEVDELTAVKEFYVKPDPFVEEFGGVCCHAPKYVHYRIHGIEAGKTYRGIVRKTPVYEPNFGTGYFEIVWMIKQYQELIPSTTDQPEHLVSQKVLSQAIIFPDGAMMIGTSYLEGDPRACVSRFKTLDQFFGSDSETDSWLYEHHLREFEANVTPAPWWRGTFLAFPQESENLKSLAQRRNEGEKGFEWGPHLPHGKTLWNLYRKRRRTGQN